MDRWILPSRVMKSILVMLSLSLLSLRTPRTQAFCQVRTFAARPRRFHRPHNNAKTLLSERLYRADRVVANRSGMSRSECSRLLKEKRIYRVQEDQKLVKINGPSEKILMDETLCIDTRSNEIALPPPLLMVYHKPKWVLSVTNDPHGRPCLDETILPKNMHPVGRLDYDTTGLLLLSSDGKLTQTLLHPKHAVEKQYQAVVTGKVDPQALTEKLANGVETSEGVHTATVVAVENWDPATVAPYLEEIKRGLPAHYNQTDLKLRGYLNIFQATELSKVTLVVNEGKYRMVRKLLANSGHEVVSLHRQRLGIIELDVEEGEKRRLTREELQWAERLYK